MPAKYNRLSSQERQELQTAGSDLVEAKLSPAQVFYPDVSGHSQGASAFGLGLPGAKPDGRVPEVITLDPNDPFDAALAEIVTTNRRKRKDYAHGTDPLTNFRETSEAMAIPGFDAVASCDFNVAQKNARLRSLRINGSLDNPENEAVLDTYLDRAVYSILAYVLYLEKMGKQ